MYFLVRFVKNNQTVVFESAGQNLVWIFSSIGSRIITGPANMIKCPELQSKSTTRIFDAKAGSSAFEPVQSAAKLVLFSSTNRNSYAQLERRVNFIAIYPSTTPDEFRRYVKMMNIDAHKVKELFASAIDRLDLDKLKQYISTSPPVYGSGNSLENPAMLFNADLDVNELEPTKSLHNLYTFSNAK